MEQASQNLPIEGIPQGMLSHEVGVPAPNSSGPASSAVPLGDHANDDGIAAGISSGQTKRPWYKRWWTWVIAALALVLVGAGVAWACWLMDHAEMPDVIGLSPEEATQEIHAASERWNIAISDIYGEAYDDEYQELEFVVIASDPEPGTVISKSDDGLAIALTVDLSPETLAKAREATIQAEIQHSLDNGFSSEDYYDGGSFIALKAISSEPSTEIHPTSQEFASINQDLYKTMAEATRANIVATAYTADGFLCGICVAPYSRSSEEEQALLTQRVNEILTNADAFAAEHLEEVASLMLSEWFGNWPGSEYSYNGSTLTFFIQSPVTDTVFVDSEGQYSAKVQQTGKERFEALTRSLAQILRCNVVMNFYDKGALDPFFSASSEKLPWFQSEA